MPSSTTPLGDMIREAAGDGLPRSKGGPSYRKLAARSVDPTTGVGASHMYLYRLGHGQVKDIPSPAHIRAITEGLIAHGLRVSPEAVWVAAVIEMMPPTDEVLEGQLAEAFERLTRPAEEQALEAIALAERQASKEPDEHRRSA